MNNLPKIKTKSGKRLGRGYGSGKGGHTSSRGTKGQKSRRKMGILFEGVKVKKSLLRRLPLSRGKGKFKANPKKPLLLSLDDLNQFKSGSLVNINSLIDSGVIKASEASYGAKVVGRGKIENKLKVALPVTKSAAAKIKDAGGTIEV